MSRDPWNPVLECPDPGALARFYSDLLDWPVVEDEGDWVIIEDGDNGCAIEFERALEPDDPRRTLVPPRTRLAVTLEVPDLADWDEFVLRLGARRRGEMGADFRTYADPSGRLFRLVGR